MENKKLNQIDDEVDVEIAEEINETGITTFNSNSLVSALNNVQDYYASFDTNTDNGKEVLFKALNSPDFKIADFINKSITIKDVYCQVVSCLNKETGELRDCPRVVIIDPEEKTYSATSFGIYNAIKNIMTVYGPPSLWKNPIEIEIAQVSKGDKKMLSLNMKKK